MIWIVCQDEMQGPEFSQVQGYRTVTACVSESEAKDACVDETYWILPVSVESMCGKYYPKGKNKSDDYWRGWKEGYQAHLEKTR